jgi:hypothetical protein
MLILAALCSVMAAEEVIRRWVPVAGRVPNAVEGILCEKPDKFKFTKTSNSNHPFE